MISYCIAVYRPRYAALLIRDLCAKTDVPFEILLWLNCRDAQFESELERGVEKGLPIRVVGRTPENIGMAAYFELFREARYEMFVQIDDDVVCVSPRIAQRAREIFGRHPRVRQVVADVWQDDFTTGARPDMGQYRSVDRVLGLYEGPIDGWFSVYHRSVLPLLPALGRGRYLPLGGMLRNLLRRRGLTGCLCTRMKVFHVIGPQYSAYFDMLDFEIEKYRSLGRQEIVDWYEGQRHHLPPPDVLESRVGEIFSQLARPVA